MAAAAVSSLSLSLSTTTTTTTSHALHRLLRPPPSPPSFPSFFFFCRSLSITVKSPFSKRTHQLQNTTTSIAAALFSSLSSRSFSSTSPLNFSPNALHPSLSLEEEEEEEEELEDYEDDDDDDDNGDEIGSDEDSGSVKLELQEDNGVSSDESGPKKESGFKRYGGLKEVPKLSVKEKKELASYAHGLGKKLKSQLVGKSGFTDNVATSFIETLEANELLKIKIHRTCPGELEDVVQRLQEATGSVVVSQIGRTVIIYRPSISKMKAEEKKNQIRKVYVRKDSKFQPASPRGQVERLTARGRRGSSRV